MTLPSDSLKKPTKRVRWIVGAGAAAAIAISAVVAGPSIASQLNPAPKPTPTVAAIGEDVATVDVPISPNSVEGSAEVAAAQAAAAQAAAEAAAQAAAAQAAADAAAKAAKANGHAAAGAPHCPSGTSMTAGDANGDPEWCLPSSCFGADPGPDCTTPIAAIKP